ncbi:MAG: Gldg family protein [Planctomycetota bacterium]
MSKTSFTLSGLLLVLVLFLAVNVAGGRILVGDWARFDLTEEKLFTLSDGAKNIARDLEEPITLQLYFSAGTAKDVPQLDDYGERVREMLREFARSSHGSIELEVIDPEPFSEEEDRAVQEGLHGVPLASGDRFFLGLVGTDPLDRREIIALFDPSKERFLEYDISRLVYKLSHPEQNKVAVLTSLPLEGSPGNPMLGQQGSDPWQVLAQLQYFFATDVLAPGVEEIPADVDVLVVVHPRAFPPATLYAIDQFVLKGGRLLAFVDPHCESDMSDVDPSNPFASMGQSKGSDLDSLFQAWGLEVVPAVVVGDRENALRVQNSSREPGAPPDIAYMVWMGLGTEAMDQDDAVTSLLQTMNFATPGGLRALPGATTQFQPLVQSSEDSMLIDVSSVQFMPRPDELRTSFVSAHERYALAARVSGEAKSAFPDGKPGGAVPDDLTDPESVDPAESTDSTDSTDSPAPAAEAAAAEGHLAAATSPINVIVVADVDMLADRFWVKEERLGPLSLGWRKFADNGDFAVNAVENLAGGDELISIRARGKFTRPFDRVEEIRRDAEQRYLDEQRTLEAKLQEAQNRINQIQREKSPDSMLILTPAQEAELRLAREEQIATNKKLRDVRHRLRQDVERLGTQVKLVNVLTIPFLMLVFAIGVAILRVRRQGT